MKDKDNFSEFVSCLSSHPGAYFGQSEHPLDRLQAFLWGMKMARNLDALQRKHWIDILFEFESVITKLLVGESNSTVAWYQEILQQNGGDQTEAYRKFFIYLEEYIKGLE